jgi:hypothetical protein
VFSKGLQFQGGGGFSRRNRISNSTFNDFVGNAIEVTGTSADYENFIIDSNTFVGTGNLVNGVNFPPAGAENWIISDNKFVGLTGSGVNIANGGNIHFCDVIGNNFESCLNGIFINQSIKQSLFINNSFSNVSGWCIRIFDIPAVNPMPFGPSIINNMARAGCVNGVQIALTTGSYDYTMLIGNNVHACSGTKWSLAAGNANGVVANNITT